MPIPALIPAAIGGAQLIGGLISRFSKKRPKREIPDSAREALGIARLQAATPYAPGYGQARESTEIAAANAMAAAQRSAGGAASAIQGVMGQQQAANRDLVAQNLQYQTGAQQRLQGALGMMAEEEDRQFQINEFAPYADRMRLSEDLIGAGATNLSSSANMLFAADQMGLLNFGKKRPSGSSRIGTLGAGALGAAAMGGVRNLGGAAIGAGQRQFFKNLVNSIYLQ